MRRHLMPLMALALYMACIAGPAFAAGLEAFFPEQVAGMPLETLLLGDEARQEIDTLHGRTIPVRDAAVATYASVSGRPAMVWVSLADSSLEAREQVHGMVDKMLAASRSPFHDYRGQERGGVALHQFLGLGQIHYIWFRDDQAWWISAPMDSGEEVLEAFLPEQ